MSDSVSPAKHRDKTVKVKYSAKGRRKRNAAKDYTKAVPGEESDAPSEASHAPASSEVVSEVPEGSPGPKAVDMNLPGPSPKPRRQNSEESRSPSKPPSTSTHHRTSLSPSVRHRQESSATKPPSSRGRPTSPSDDADETESVAESSSGTRIYRSEPERIEYFKKQPECGELEPHRAFCTRCDSWINLGKGRTYIVRPWERHRAKCDPKPPAAKETKPTSTEDVTEVKEDEPALISLHLSVAMSPGKTEPSLTPEDKPPSKTESSRLAVLQADFRAQEIKPHEVFCRACQKWIKLSPHQPYVLTNWQSHQQHCTGSTYVPRSLRPSASKETFSPQGRVATTERKIALLNDPQVKAVTTRSVCCACCKDTVMLGGEVDYDHTKWNEHKKTCIPVTPAAPTTASKALSSRLSFPPPTPGNVTTPTPISRTSSRSLIFPRSPLTDAVPIIDGPTAKTGDKRAREEGGREVVEDSRPSNRPRTEDYKPPEREPPGPWGWFMQPLKAFIRGFREGLGTPT